MKPNSESMLHSLVHVYSPNIPFNELIMLVDDLKAASVAVASGLTTNERRIALRLIESNQYYDKESGLYALWEKDYREIRRDGLIDIVLW